MTVYRPISSEILKLEKELDKFLFKIILPECGIRNNSNQFFFKQYTGFIYIKFFSCENSSSKNTLGFYNSLTCTIHINYHYYLHMDTDQKLNLIRHEWMHALCTLLFPNSSAHGTEFRRLCESFGYNEKVYLAQVPREDMAQIELARISKIKSDKKNLERMEKIKALTKSSEVEEASVALRYLQEYDLKSFTEDAAYFETSYFETTIWEGKRLNPLVNALALLLPQFNVRTIIYKTNVINSLNAIGTVSDLNCATEIYLTLSEKLNFWWSEFKKQKTTNRASATSFYHGVTTGFFKRLEDCKKQMNTQERSLMVIREQELEKYFEIAYPRISKHNKSFTLSAESFHAGKIAGGQLGLKNLLT